MDAVTFPIRVFKQLGVDTVVCKFAKDLSHVLRRISRMCCYSVQGTDKRLAVTNAAGGLNSEYRVGDIVLLNDARLLSTPTYSN